MKKIIITLTVGILISCSVPKKIGEVSKVFEIKSIYLASYEVRRNGEMTRENAFEQELDKAEFYNENGFLIEYWLYNINGTIYEKTKLENDDKGRLLKTNTYDNSGVLKSYLETEFDNNGNIIFKRIYNSENEITFIQKNEYDSRGNNIRSSFTAFDFNETKENQFIKRIESDSIKTYKTLRKYNSKNQLIEKTEFEPDGKIDRVETFKYDEKGNEVESELKMFNGNYFKYVSNYNERNNISTQKTIGKNGSIEQQYNWEYLYDERNNWITKKSFSNGQLVSIWERKIEYY